MRLSARARGCFGPTHSASRPRAGGFPRMLSESVPDLRAGSTMETATTPAMPLTSALATRHSSPRRLRSVVADACDAANAASSSPHMASASNTPTLTMRAHARTPRRRTTEGCPPGTGAARVPAGRIVRSISRRRPRERRRAERRVGATTRRARGARPPRRRRRLEGPSQPRADTRPSAVP